MAVSLRGAALCRLTTWTQIACTVPCWGIHTAHMLCAEYMCSAIARRREPVWVSGRESVAAAARALLYLEDSLLARRRALQLISRKRDCLWFGGSYRS